MRSICFYGLCMLFLFICCNNQNNEVRSTTLSQSSDEFNYKIKVNAICQLLVNDSSINEIIKKPSIVLNLSDSCIFEILDSFTISAKENKIYYSALNSIYAKSDGSISEYYIDVMTKVFYSDYSGISEYLFLNKDNKLRGVLIEALSMDVSDAGNSKARREEIQKIIHLESKDANLEKYMIELEHEINPKMFD